MMIFATLSVIGSRVRESPSRRQAFSNATPIAAVASGSKTLDCSYGLIGIIPPRRVARSARQPSRTAAPILAARLALRRRARRNDSSSEEFSSSRGRPLSRDHAHRTGDTRWRKPICASACSIAPLAPSVRLCTKRRPVSA